MNSYTMCPSCQTEYTTPTNRRYHAQPNACPNCGPQLKLIKPDRPLHHLPSPLLNAARAIAQGRIVAIKALGGYQLACDATNSTVVARLRRRKKRPTKPLAIMCADQTVVRKFCLVSKGAGRLLTSPIAPIVLLPKRAKPDIALSPLLAPNNRDLGVMLAYTPLHILLLQQVSKLTGKPAVLVMTSANRRDDPIVASEEELLAELPGVVDLVLTHDRPIANRCDDSVVQPGRPSLAAPVIVRRARGYVPQPVVIGPTFHVKHPVLAFGGEMRNCFALAQKDQVFLSPHIGSLDSVRAQQFFEMVLSRYRLWTGVTPQLIACDLHPDYSSTRLAETFAQREGLPLIRVQHHVAHVLSVMAEHRLAGPVLGLAFDGTGFGTDGAIWGCEFLLIDEQLGWARVGHLAYLDLPEGDDGGLADPARVAAAYLEQVGMGQQARLLDLPVIKMGSGRKGPKGWVRTSSLGRLFDAIAAISGVCRKVSYEGEAAIGLEAAASSARNNFELRTLHFEQSFNSLVSPPVVLAPDSFLKTAVQDRLNGLDPAAVAARFHARLIQAVYRATVKLCEISRVRTVCLSGGSFQNRLLRYGLTRRLTGAGITVFHNRLVPLNDGGLALGQVLAAKGWKNERAKQFDLT